jgi:hypothetical protein
MRGSVGARIALTALVGVLAFGAGTARANLELFQGDEDDNGDLVSGAFDFKDVTFGTGLTECPQAGLKGAQPRPLDRRVKDQAERRSDGGDDIRANQDYSCMPQDETAIDQNPNNSRNYVAGANDYRLGWGTSGFYSTTDGGNSWYDGITPFPSLPSGDNLDGGGDPVTTFDRDGVVYYAQINFNRTDDTSGVWVNRSTNGGFTWTRPCVAIGTSDSAAACGGPGDPRQPGDGTVAFQQDNDAVLNGSVPSYDKEWLTAGPRPAGVQPTCFGPITHTPATCNPAVVGSDRLYVTYSLFSAAGSAQIFFEYSDDQARSWSAPKLIDGSGAFCASGGRAGNECADSQGSEPTVNPKTGQLWVGFENGDTTDEDQYLVVTSKDGGQTFSQPVRVDTLYDVNEPRGVNGRTDCNARGQGTTRADLTNTCFRADPIMNSIVADKRGGDFADDVYVVLYDNRNGTIRDSNNDVFFYKSTDGGSTWIGPTRVNDDRSTTPANRDCGRNTNSIRGNSANCPEQNYGGDQFFAFITISQRGDLNVVFHDRRLDTSSPAGMGAWPTSKTEVGNYLVWNWGAQCRISQTRTVTQTGTGPVPSGASQCVAPEAVVNPTAATGFNPGAGPVPGNNQDSRTLPFRNFQVSDFGTNFDYTFRAGLFAGDYNGNATGPKLPNGNDNGEDRTAAFFTDARNGRGSGDPTSTQPGRNPICEQSDVFFDTYSSWYGGNGARGGSQDSNVFLVAPCPTDIKDHRQHW